MVRRGLVRVLAVSGVLAVIAAGCGRERGVGLNTDPARPPFEPEMYELAWCDGIYVENHWSARSPGDPKHIQAWEQPTGEQMQWQVREIKRLFGEEDVDWHVVEPGGEFPLRLAAGFAQPEDDRSGAVLDSDLPELRREGKVITSLSKLERMKAEHGRGSTLYVAFNQDDTFARSWFVHAISIRKDGKVVALGECPGVTRVLLGAPDPRAVVELLREGKLDEAERILLAAWPVPSTTVPASMPTTTLRSLVDVQFKGPPELFVRLTNQRFALEIPEGWRSTPASTPALLCPVSPTGQGGCLNVRRARPTADGLVTFTPPVMKDEDLELRLKFSTRREVPAEVVVARVPASLIAEGGTIEIRGLPEAMPTEPGDYTAGVRVAKAEK